MNVKVLFVDDEASVLRGLRRSIVFERPDWEVRISESGEAALVELEHWQADVVVSDMRMPKMDGCELLTRIANLYPRMVRIVLSGQSSRESNLKALGLTHQVLSKPCECNQLITAIERSCRLRAQLASPDLQKAVGALQSLPSPPQRYFNLVEALNQPEVSLTAIAEMISGDVGMIAKVLQLVSSSFFGLGRRITSVSEAAAYLGLDTLKSVVAMAEVFTRPNDLGIPGFLLEDLESHSLRVGIVAKRITTEEGGSVTMAEEAFLAGVLHDCGKLVLAESNPMKYRQVVKKAAELGWSGAERKMFGDSHAHVGAYLVGLWGMSDSVVEAVAFHHEPDNFDCNVMSPSVAVCAADFLCRGGWPEQICRSKLEGWQHLAA